MADKRDPLTPPEDSDLDEGARALVRALTGSIPVAGAPLSELLDLIIRAPLKQRVQEWQEEVMRRILALEKRVADFDAETLKDNSEFASAVIDAQMALLRSDASEKREALTNAVINVALGRGPDEDRRQMLMGYISDLTPWHLRLLSLMNDPAGIAQARGVDMSHISTGGISTLVERVFPELRGEQPFYAQLANDLNARGLMENVGFNVTMSGHGIMTKRTTKMGEDFLRFVSEPFELG